MPTGYTCDIYNGECLSAKDYILKCARAFGATITMRDESLKNEIPEEFKPDTYHKDKIEHCKSKLNELTKMTTQEIQDIIDKDYESNIKSDEKYIKELLELKDRYTKVLLDVKEWTVPTEDHFKLKEFCIKQLEESINWDCHTDYSLNSPIKITTDEWLVRKFTSYSGSLRYHTKCWNEEVERTKQRNLWIKQLRDSLEHF